MILHPAIENLIKLVNDDSKVFSKENIKKWCSSLPKEEKDFFTRKLTLPLKLAHLRLFFLI